MKQNETITQTEAIYQITKQMKGQIDLDEFVNQVLEIWPSSAKNPKTSVRQTIRDEHIGKDLLFLDEKTLIPMRLAMNGIRFRIPLTRREIYRGWLFVYPAFQFMAQRGIAAKDFHLEDDKGQTIPVNPVNFKSTVNTIFGPQEQIETAFNLGWWYKKHNLRRGDGLLATILDWEIGHFRLLLESSRTRQQHETEIQQQNQALADHLFQALETARYEYVWGHAAIPTALLRLKNPEAYPADHWFEILEKDPRMKWMGHDITYADWTSPIERIFRRIPTPPEAHRKPSAKSLSPVQNLKVYRFKAFLKYRKGIWRQIEIQGNQTLADFDHVLRDAFEHDQIDHLSGFWKLVQRGQGPHYREVDLGNIHPFEGGEAAEIRVSSMELVPGEALKYVYDFGDWIEHRIELETIVEPEKDATYPRIVGQNKPRHHHCLNCKEVGREEIATLVCITCSNLQQENIFICDACAEAGHEDHYLEVILY